MILVQMISIVTYLDLFLSYMQVPCPGGVIKPEIAMHHIPTNP